MLVLRERAIAMLTAGMSTRALPENLLLISLPSNQMLFVTCTEYNRCRAYREMLTYKPLTNNAVQEIELRKYLLNKLKEKM
jgi:hypothetical protein